MSSGHHGARGTTARTLRMSREVQDLHTSPPTGAVAWPVDGRLDHLRAELMGPEGTPYEGGYFVLDIKIPEQYPNLPPQVRFVTTIYHPNIDSSGRICHESLNMPPKGRWAPALTISQVLAMLLVLLSEPDASDGLVPEVTQLYQQNRAAFDTKAREWTRRHAYRDQDRAVSAGGGNSNVGNEDDEEAGADDVGRAKTSQHDGLDNDNDTGFVSDRSEDESASYSSDEDGADVSGPPAPATSPCPSRKPGKRGAPASTNASSPGRKKSRK